MNKKCYFNRMCYFGKMFFRENVIRIVLEFWLHFIIATMPHFTISRDRFCVIVTGVSSLKLFAINKAC